MISFFLSLTSLRFTSKTIVSFCLRFSFFYGLADLWLQPFPLKLRFKMIRKMENVFLFSEKIIKKDEISPIVINLTSFLSFFYSYSNQRTKKSFNCFIVCFRYE